MSKYTDNELAHIFSTTTRPLNALSATMHPRDAAVDELGNTIYFSHYGKSGQLYAWEVDHRNAKALGGSNQFSNLRALALHANRSLGGFIGGRR